MNDHDDASGADEQAGERLRAIAAELSAAGLVIHLHQTRAGLDLTAALHHPGLRETDVLVDEDGYTELRYWADQAASPTQAADIIVHALSVVSDIRAASRPSDPARTPPHTEAFPVLRLPDPAIGTITGYDGAVTERAGDGGMAGSRDAPTERQVSADSVRKNWPDKADPELVKRLEQLQPGHPSSPYNADGTRKPPVPDTTDRELPIPGDPYYEADDVEFSDSLATPDSPEHSERSTADGGPDQELHSADEPWTCPDGSWAWRGQRLTPERSCIADQAAERCQEAEGRDADGNYGEYGLTPAMHRIDSQLKHGHLVDKTEEYALKGADRFKEKLAKMISDEPDADPNELVSRIIDGVRYTFEFPDEEYCIGVVETCNSLTTAGYELYERKNAWADEAKSYKGINSTWMDHGSGMLFEVQMHTPTSWAAKQESHDQYEIIESQSSTSGEKIIARKRQNEIFARVAVPEGAIDIPSYRKEGW